MFVSLNISLIIHYLEAQKPISPGHTINKIISQDYNFPIDFHPVASEGYPSEYYEWLPLRRSTKRLRIRMDYLDAYCKEGISQMA